MFTYKDLLEELVNFTEEQLKAKVTVFVNNEFERVGDITLKNTNVPFLSVWDKYGSE